MRLTEGRGRFFFPLKKESYLKPADLKLALQLRMTLNSKCEITPDYSPPPPKDKFLLECLASNFWVHIILARPQPKYICLVRLGVDHP